MSAPRRSSRRPRRSAATTARASGRSSPTEEATMELEGKRTLVTGAARGLGLAIAELFAERGARVALADIDGDAAAAAAQDIGDAIALRCDVTNPADVRETIAGTVEAFGALDVLVNNAGIEIGKPISETGDEEFARLM